MSRHERDDPQRRHDRDKDHASQDRERFRGKDREHDPRDRPRYADHGRRDQDRARGGRDHRRPQRSRSRSASPPGGHRRHQRRGDDGGGRGRGRGGGRGRGRDQHHQRYEWGRPDQQRGEGGGSSGDEKPPPQPKQQANMGLSGKLAQDTNTYKGVLIKYSEPANARLPKKRWRLYPFKGEEAMKPLYVHRQSGYLIGRDRKITDIPLDHPSISKQHAALQYRMVESEQADGSKLRLIRPYIIDLESANGTYLNGSRIDPRRYVELKEQDVVKFGFSSREYVVLSETAAGEDGAGDERASPSNHGSDSEPEGDDK